MNRTNKYMIPKVDVCIDLQYGSTGKGLLASYLAYHENYDAFVTSNGAQAGHTGFLYDSNARMDRKVVAFNLPIGGIANWLLGRPKPIYLTGGAIIDPESFKKELDDYGIEKVYVHPTAAIITPEHKKEDAENTRGISGTGKGVGASLAAKIRRKNGVVAKDWYAKNPDSRVVILDVSGKTLWERGHRRILYEVPQGYSLGINSEFYPYTTSRECTVMQAMSDGRISPSMLGRIYGAARTYPIRVGSLPGSSSGGCYPDQYEISWEDLGFEPELTTVTKRTRRIFTFSEMQFQEAAFANDVDVVFMNFMNYMTANNAREFVSRVDALAEDVLGRPVSFLFGFGPKVEDVFSTSELVANPEIFDKYCR